jgi:hypothetical protein
VSAYLQRTRSYLLAKLVPILDMSVVEVRKLVFDVDRSVGLAAYS